MAKKKVKKKKAEPTTQPQIIVNLPESDRIEAVQELARACFVNAKAINNVACCLKDPEIALTISGCVINNTGECGIKVGKTE
jgi:hypothetical protein